MIIPVLVPYFQSLGLSMRDIFILQSIYSLAFVACEIPTGYICDWVGRKKVLCMGSFLMGCCFTGLFLVKSMKGLLVFELLTALAVSLISGADIALIYDFLTDKSRISSSRAIANLQLSQVSAESIASVLGGLLATFSFSHVFFAQACVGWVPLLIAMTFSETRSDQSNVRRRDHFDYFKKSVSHVLADGALKKMIFLNLVTWNLSTFFVVWVLQRYWQERGISLVYFGCLWALFNISAGITGKQVPWLKKSLGSIPLLVFIGLAPVFAYFGMSLFSGFLGCLLGLLLYCARGVTQVLLRDAFNTQLSSEFRATANSLHTFLFKLSFAILGPCIGYTIDQWGMNFALKCLGYFCLLMNFVVLAPLIFHARQPNGAFV